MSQIKGKDTKPEMIVRKFLFSQGYRFRIHDKRFPGKPDVVLPKYRTAIFIHGCFWHGHIGCKYFVIPKSRTKWWSDKISRNKERDDQNMQNLTKDHWKVISVFECELKLPVQEKTFNKILKLL